MSKERRDLAAFLECGCVAIIMVLESDIYTASAKDIADFYKEVHKAQTRKRNPLKLRVEEIRHTNWKMRCSVCDPRLELQGEQK